MRTTKQWGVFGGERVKSGCPLMHYLELEGGVSKKLLEEEMLIERSLSNHLVRGRCDDVGDLGYNCFGGMMLIFGLLGKLGKWSTIGGYESVSLLMMSEGDGDVGVMGAYVTITSRSRSLFKCQKDALLAINNVINASVEDEDYTSIDVTLKTSLEHAVEDWRFGFCSSTFNSFDKEVSKIVLFLGNTQLQHVKTKNSKGDEYTTVVSSLGEIKSTKHYYSQKLEL
ncbi:hypothetical protein Tco_0264528 [Tanacetum coccineum]